MVSHVICPCLVEYTSPSLVGICLPESAADGSYFGGGTDLASSAFRRYLK